MPYLYLIETKIIRGKDKSTLDADKRVFISEKLVIPMRLKCRNSKCTGRQHDGTALFYAGFPLRIKQVE